MKKEIMETLKLNEKDGKKKIVLIFIASLLAMAAAVYGIFHMKKSDKTETKKDQKTKKQPKARAAKAKKVSASKKNARTSMKRGGWNAKKETAQPSAAITAGKTAPAVPRQMYVVHPLPEKKQESKARRFRRHMSAAVAVILVISLVGSGSMNYVQPSTVLAKGSFSGISGIVQEHSDADEPYVILDIVPTVAKYGDYQFSTGTMGYLVSGQAPLVQDLKELLIDKPNFYDYIKRTKLLENVTVSQGTFPDVQYKEAYAGVLGVDSVSSSSNWIRMFDKVSGVSADGKKMDGLVGENVPTGFFTGKAEQFKNGDTTGYDFNLIELKTDLWKSNSLSDGYFELNPYGGSSRVRFEASEDGNYVAMPAYSLEEIAYSAPSTWVYIYDADTDTYVWTGLTIWDLVKDQISQKTNEHEHSFNTDVWEKNGTHHWYACTVQGCNITDEILSLYSDVNGYAPHSFDVTGSSEKHNLTCSICGYEESVYHEWTEDIDACTICGVTNPDKVTNDNEIIEDETADNTPDEEESSNDSPSENEQSGEGNQQDEDEKSDEDVDNPDYPETEEGDEEPDETVDDSSESNSGETGNGTDGSGDSTETGTYSEELEIVKNTAVSGRWYKLSSVDESNPIDDTETGHNRSEEFSESSTTISSEIGTGTETDEETGTDQTAPIPEIGSQIDLGNNTANTSFENIDWGSVDWSKFGDYCVVTFRVLEFDEDPEGQTLYNSIEVESSLGSMGDVYDAYTKKEGGEELQISTYSFMLGLPTSDTTPDGIFEYVGPGQGDWKLERVADKSVGTGIGTIMVWNVPVYFRCSSSNDWLKQYVFSTLSGGDNDNSNFNIEVNTVRAEAVTPEMIWNADLIYMEGGAGNTVLGNLTSEYFTEAVEGDADMGADVVDVILQRVSDELMPVIVDYDIVKDSEHYQDTNYQFLARALLKRDVAEFYEAENVDGNLMENIRMGITSEDYPDKTDNNYNYVNKNVYIVNDSSPLVSSDFADEFEDDKARAGFLDVLLMIRAENTTRSEENKIPESVSKSMAMQYIINYSVGIIGELSDLTFLELQPTANISPDLGTVQDTKGYTKLVLQTDRMSSGSIVLTSKKSFSIYPTVKSVAEFNGEWEDINGVYDFIFIGLDGKRLNRADDKDRTAQYNNSELEGKVYHRGDNSNTGLGNYDANDITAQKMDSLLEYMAAGYPVLVENDCFVDGSAQKATSEDVNTKYIAEDSIMCRFLKAAVSDERYKNHIYTVSDATTGSFMTQVQISKPRISLVSENGEEVSTTLRSIQQDENGEYHGQIAYAVKDNRGNAYESAEGWKVSVYADYDYDGVFEPEEEVTEIVNEDGVIDVTIGNMGPGILPWKLEVSDNANVYRRDSVQGYFEIGSTVRGELKVLQITQRANDADVNLQTMFHSNADSMLANYLRGAETTLNSDMQFETVDATELLIRLAENAKYLEQWDVVVLNLEGMDAVEDIITTAITDYANDGRSLLVCGSVNSGTSRAGLSPELLGQSDSSTYVQLGASGASGYPRYNGLNSDMYGGSTGLLAEVVNDGSISYYPYEISGAGITVGAEVDLKASAYLLDFENNLKSDDYTTYVTPWYTLGGSSDTAYGVSPRDAGNNYYCYSKGNVVYLAQSSYPYVKDSGVGDDESKFFVNALVAAYSAGVHNANVRIVAGFAEDSADVESIAVPFDQIWLEAGDSTGGILDNTVDVYFKFRDNNIANSKYVVVGFYYQNPNSSELVNVGGKLENASPFPTPIWTVTNNRLTLVGDGTLEPGQVYRIEAPVITLRENGNETKADIYIVVETTVERSGHTYKVISSDTVSLNRAQLFLLE